MKVGHFHPFVSRRATAMVLMLKLSSVNDGVDYPRSLAIGQPELPDETGIIISGGSRQLA